MFETRIEALVLTATLSAAGPAMLARPVSAESVEEKVTVTPVKTISPQEEAMISRVARFCAISHRPVPISAAKSRKVRPQSSARRSSCTT